MTGHIPGRPHPRLPAGQPPNCKANFHSAHPRNSLVSKTHDPKALSSSRQLLTRSQDSTRNHRKRNPRFPCRSSPLPSSIALPADMQETPVGLCTASHGLLPAENERFFQALDSIRISAPSFADGDCGGKPLSPAYFYFIFQFHFIFSVKEDTFQKKLKI
ncbi:no significant blast hit [Histoplasma capsulatum G186AR]|uniref:Uncharacterized protein n=1 Tax=Ajellomyces capsulatus TaxID=5037 RepID=A0A8H7YJ34_AJECA|nr:hypothetical protein I7I52_08068 [Histoplasma capsulatum]QSS72830.1 no significant blast hit [Histoplasma capsulatum G186AR]